MPLQIVQRALPGAPAHWAPSYGPPGEGPFPAILLLHGSEGAWSGLSHRNAVLLAAQGFLALPFGYSKGGNYWNAGSIHEVPLDRTVEALDRLRAWHLAGPKLGLYGWSRGAEHALLLASLMVRDGLGGVPDALAVHSPPDVVCGAFHAARWRDRGDPGWQVWDPADRAWTWRGESEGLLPTTAIEIERYQGPLLISHGTADPVWSVETTRRIETRLRAAGREAEVHYQEGGGHLPEGEAANRHFERLAGFFGRHLSSDRPLPRE